MLDRKHDIKLIQDAFAIHPACAILGPRQCGKTTLALQYAQQFEKVHHFDLENPQHLNLFEQPSLTLPSLEGLIIIDEIQRKPDLFPYLRYLIDHMDKKFLILGSASQDLIRQSSETLAGRISYLELRPFLFQDTNDMRTNWARGGFPKSYLAPSNELSEKWRLNYIKTFLERDLSLIGIDVAPVNMRRLWSMLAHYHAQIANISELTRSLDMSNKTVKKYMDILEGCFMIRQLRPWHENLSKRQVKRPKVFIRDSGLLHTLLGIKDTEITTHPKCGASWEGYAMENIIQSYDNDLNEFYFWATEKGAELDLLVISRGKKHGYEFKFSEAPKATKSMHIAFEDLALDTLTVVTPGESSYPLTESFQVKSLSSTLHHIKNSS